MCADCRCSGRCAASSPLACRRECTAADPGCTGGLHGAPPPPGAIVTEPGTVAFPLWPHAGVGTGALPEPTRFDVPDGWQDWLIQLFNFQTTPFSGRGYSRNAITDLLRRPGSRPAASPRSGTTESAPLTSLEMPRAPARERWPRSCPATPLLDLTVDQWAARVFCSPRTLRRDFLADTGLTFEQWRLRNRLIAAVELLAAGYDVDQTAARVGFASRNGFTRAFKQQYGQTPHAVTRNLA